MNNIIFFGPPGAGKGTQAKIISEFLKIPHLSTGEILRSKILEKDKLAKKLNEIMSSGKLVSDEILNSIVSSQLETNKKNGFILDGYPRSSNQLEFLRNYLQKSSINIDFIFNISIEFAILRERILKRSSEENREDDKIEVIETRYSEYISSTKIVSDYYKNSHNDIFYEIDGSLKIGEITDKIKKILKKS